MKREVTFSKVARDKLESTLTYLESEFSEATKLKFLKSLNSCFKQIDLFPNSFKYSNVLKVNIALVTKHTSFYYVYNKEEIVVLFFIDHRMNNIID